MTTATQTLRLHRLEIDSFLRINALTVDANGQHVVVSGSNGCGKTSCAAAIWTAIKGLSSKQFPEPIHHGAEKARIKLDLGEFVIERIITPSGSRLNVVAADGSRIPKPQAFLDGLLAELSLDPVAFLDQRPQDQVDVVLSVCGVAPPVERVRAATDEDHPAKPGESAATYLERLSADEVGLFYIRRREAHRHLEQKAGALDEQRRIVEALGGPIPPEDAPASASSLLAEIEALNIQGESRRAAVMLATDARLKFEQANSRLGTIKHEFETEQKACDDLARQIAELQHRLEERQGKASGLANRIHVGMGICTALGAEATEAETAAQALPDPSPKIQQLRQEIAKVEQTNAQRSKRQHASEQYDRLAQELERGKLEHKRLDDVLERLRDIRAHLLDGVDIGFPGLEVGQGELRLNGVSFKQASGAERLRTACAVACKQNPRLKILRVDGGEALDKHSRELLFDLAERHDYRVIFMSVSDEQELQIEVVEAGQ